MSNIHIGLKIIFFEHPYRKLRHLQMLQGVHGVFRIISQYRIGMTSLD